MNKYIINKQGLLDTLAAWDGFLQRKVRLIACGGTALTLLGVKDSTKDIDFMVPDLNEHRYLIDTLKKLGYTSASGWGWAREGGFVFDLFRGKSMHTTELLESPLEKENHILIKEYSHVYAGELNYYDIIISKLFRGTGVDHDDCLALVKNKKKTVHLLRLEERFRKTASFDVSEDRVIKNWEHFLTLLKEEGLYHGKK